LVFARFDRRKSSVVVLIAFLVGASIMSIRQVSLQTSQIHKSIGKNLTLEFNVISDPKSIRNGKLSLIAKARGVPVRVIGYGEELLPSTTFIASGKLLESKEPRVAALFVSWQKFRVIAPANIWQQQLGDVRSGLREVSKSAPLIPGMVLGDTSLQSPEFTDAMRRAGLTHLTAVSGANFAIVSAFLLWTLQFFIKSLRLRLLITALFLIAFIGLVRPSPSVLRAAAMAAVVIFAKSHREKSDSLPSLGFAIAIVVIADPWQSRDPGFALSVLATAGLLLIAPKLKMPKLLAEPIAASLLCAPIIVALSGYLSITAIIANALAAPFVAPLTILGFLATVFPITAPFLIPITKIFAGVITKIAFLAAAPPVIQMKSAFLILIVGLFGILFKEFIRKYWFLILLTLLLLTYLQRWPNNEWQIANCDVGQGDALVLKVAAHSAVVIDTGPEPKIVDNCLKSLSIHHIPLLILTHSHADHVGGLTGAIANRRVDQVITSAKRGEVFQVGELMIEILWPDGRDHSFTDNGGEGSEVNNKSITTLITTPSYSLLATGDLEPDAQREIAVRRVDFLKVAHHGSKFQDQRFNELADPKIAIISVGKGNRYGHPAQETLKLFDKVIRTDISGAVAIDPNQMSISSSKVGIFGLPVIWRVA
jgi:competence protein ComEC